MNLAAFEAFVKVMETGSISLAADQLFITQPAVTKRIHSLEEYFGVKLLSLLVVVYKPHMPRIHCCLKSKTGSMNWVTFITP